jgi:hypothetical protein
MKTIVSNLFFIILLCLAIEGCKDDSSDDGSTKNAMKVDGTDYDLSKGFVINYGDYNSVFAIDLFLISPGLTVHEFEGLPDSASGTGQLLTFEIFSSSGDKIAVGDYVYSDSENVGTFYYSGYMLNWNATQNPFADLTEISSGTLNVINSGAQYEISFSGKDSNNKDISGYYKGSLKYYDDSGKKKSQKRSWY